MNFLIIITLLINILLLIMLAKCEEHVCQNTDIRKSLQDFYQLNDCTRVEGYVRIFWIENITYQQFANLSFPKLTEITDYLLLYRIFNLVSLDKLFPNLTYIRGRILFYDYALVINNLPHLQRIAFNNIKHIRGGVRIERNPKLCLTDSDDYQLISKAAKTHTQQKLSSIASRINVTSKSDNEIGFLLNWNSSAKQNNIITYYIISITEIVNSSDFIDRKYYCNKTSPFEANYKRFNDCENKNKDFILNYVEHEFEDGENFLNIIIDFMTDKQKKNNSLLSIKPKTVTNPTTMQQIKNSTKFKVNASEKGYRISNLKHFTPYFVKVNECQDLTPALNRNSPVKCSVIGIERIETLAKISADSINESSIKFASEANSISIKWEEPKDPNGFIISYHIEYKELRKERMFYLCVDHNKYLLNNKSYTITGLDYSENYSFKLRANSLGGIGKWTQFHNFTFPLNGNVLINPLDESNTGKSNLLTILISFSIIMSLSFFLIAFICYLKSPAKEKSIDVISFNPEYEKFIVDPEWEVKKSDIRLLNVLGDGAFGRVYAGELIVNEKVTKCAVKKLKSNARSEERENFLKEANIMKSFVDCHHIVKLLGIVSMESPVLVLMEFMANGDLKTYLRSNRPDNYDNPNARLPSLSRILQMAIEISDGMSYLASRKFVHRDLAARNCMVSADLTVKIGDFGMTRDIYDCDYYRKRDCGLIPVRWMSPESLRDGVFTTYSDIWSYGVVLWEMITLGSQPYQGLSNEYVFKYVVGGGIMKEPENCPKKIWKIISCCWKKNPKLRPSFSEIIEMLLPSANQRFGEVSFYLNHKPFIAKHQSLKKIWNNFSTPIKQMNKLILNEEKPIDNFCEDPNDLLYFPMNPTFVSIDHKNNMKSPNNQLKSLNQTNQTNQILNSTNMSDHQNNQIIKYLSHEKSIGLIGDDVCQQSHYRM